MQYFTANLTLLVTALKKVTSYILKDFSELSYLQLNSDSSSNIFANNSYKFVENKIITDIKNIKPDYSYILQNGAIIDGKDTSNYIVVSNICGFENYKKGLPFFVLSLALIRDNQELAAAVYQPLFDTLLVAEKGKGAYLNKCRLKTNYRNLENCLPIVATNNCQSIPSNLQNSKLLSTNCYSLDLCYLSSFKTDLCFYKNPINYFEVLPALIIAKEAGYEVTYNKEGSNINNLIAGNAFIRDSLKI